MSDGTSLTILTRTCGHCPFAGEFDGLRPGRLRDIREECLREDAPFVCHRTVDRDDEENGSSPVFGPAAVCAGWLKIDDPIQVVQVATRLGLVEYKKPYDTCPH